MSTNAPVTLTTNKQVYLFDVHRPRHMPSFVATIHAYGTFGGGTLTFQISTDGGTTKTTNLQENGADKSLTSANAFNYESVSNPSESGKVKIYATLTGATSPSIVIDSFDNN